MPRNSPDWAYETVYGPFLALGGEMGHTRNAQNMSASREALMERMYRRILTEMCMNRFKWEGLPKSIDLRYLELTLFNNALSVFYFDDKYDKFLALLGNPMGNLNFYQNPTRFIVNGNASFLSKTLLAKEVAPIWSNYLRVPDIDIVLIYSRKLAELDRTIEINSKNARMPTVLTVNENTKLSGDNILRQVHNGNPVITVNADGQFGNGAINDVIQSFDLGIDPDAVEKLHILRARLWGECMGLLGIDFANQDKKERLVAAEVGANDGQIDSMRRVNLNAREQAAQLIMDKFGPGSRHARLHPDNVITSEVKVSYHIDESTIENMYDVDPSDNNGMNA